MRLTGLTLRLVIIFAVAAGTVAAQGIPGAGSTATGTPPQRGAGGGGRGGGGGGAMALTTTAWPDGGLIPLRYTQAGLNGQPGEQISPELKWTNAPAGTQSFVLHMMDPDVAAQRGTETQVHWLVWNIPGTASGLAEGIRQGSELADGSRQISATGPVYRGPGAPATGPVHHYTFEVYALDTKLDVQPSTNAQPVPAAVETRTNVFKAMQGHVLGKAVYVGLFRRPPQ